MPDAEELRDRAAELVDRARNEEVELTGEGRAAHWSCPGLVDT